MSALQELRGLLKVKPLQLLALACLLVVLAGLGVKAGTPIRDPDIWWHTKVGDWIVQNHAVPHVGILSRTAGSRPWVAYSWGSEVLQSRAFDWFGLVGFALYGVVLTMGVAWTLFWMAYRLSGRFWVGWLLCGIGSLSFLYSLMPRPVFFSMMLYMVVLVLLSEAHRTQRVWKLAWLPLVFVFWANVHIQFIYGIAVVGLFVGAQWALNAAERFGALPRWIAPSQLPAAPLAMLLAGCVLGACVGPYTYHLYEVVFTYSQSKAAYSLIQELQPPDYRSFTQYVLALLIAAGFLAVGLRKKIDVFWLALLAVAAVSAFRTARDGWFAGASAAACIAGYMRSEEHGIPRLRWPQLAATWSASAVLLFLVLSNSGFTTRELDRAISSTYPVDALNYLRRNPARGPLYNHLDWGGFIAWYMPQYPVFIDGRNDLYGDDFDIRAFRSLDGDYSTDPYLKESGVVVLPKKAPLAVMLKIDPEFELVYEDNLATVLVRK